MTVGPDASVADGVRVARVSAAHPGTGCPAEGISVVPRATCTGGVLLFHDEEIFLVVGVPNTAREAFFLAIAPWNSVNAVESLVGSHKSLVIAQ